MPRYLDKNIMKYVHMPLVCLLQDNKYILKYRKQTLQYIFLSTKFDIYVFITIFVVHFTEIFLTHYSCRVIQNITNIDTINANRNAHLVIHCARRVPEITLIRNAHSEPIGKSNNVNVFESRKPKEVDGVAKISYGCYAPRGFNQLHYLGTVNFRE